MPDPPPPKKKKKSPQKEPVLVQNIFYRLKPFLSPNRQHTRP